MQNLNAKKLQNQNVIDICNKYLALQRKKGHSPEISFKKVTLLGLISIAEFYLNNLSSLIITCDSIRICCQFVVKIILKSPQTRINTGFICPNFSLSGTVTHPLSPGYLLTALQVCRYHIRCRL